MDLFLDLLTFFFMRAQKKGFENEEQRQRGLTIIAKLLQLYPEAAHVQIPASAPPAPPPPPPPPPPVQQTMGGGLADWGLS